MQEWKEAFLWGLGLGAFLVGMAWFTWTMSGRQARLLNQTSDNLADSGRSDGWP